MKNGFPIATSGLRVGLLGGSFDPPHNGHLHISKWALKEFGLDQVWWLVSPGNPLKKRGPASLERRMAACEELVQHPRIKVTDLECQLGTRYTAETLERLLAIYSDVRFVWLMGADNLANFHKWDRWDDIMMTLPIGVLARPEEQVMAGSSPAARRFSKSRLSARRSTALPFRSAPCWSLLNGPMVDMSSTEIRKRGDW
ncbi:nicotinate-nucleotide adenylyltransferase [Amylibacter sp. SFDW26]|uniref:nicotinate-nucleotide adenylyltransferase n=1 Tax=Amylibacter sp. SFDW26 TaxID=2652722 RepID=UPI00126265A0|nr:nicotinate-nucleotide adenylyltransferase [Amylibacter sp. SFDW26]KAB7613420.1 nicotinate-nucleotide adenylyltransferase [Amylibacter sp. SFDW26]